MDNEAAIFKVLADATRLRLAVLLSIQGETCVCALATALDAPEYKISRHLGIMRAAGVVETRRDGTWMYYRLAHARNRLEECLQDCFRDCLANHKTVEADMKRLLQASCQAEK